MDKTWIVWYDLTYRVEVKAPDQEAAREIARDCILLDENLVDCKIYADEVSYVN
jgi:Fe-S-cluster containining protein